MKTPYINIHTHKAESGEGNLELVNLFPDERIPSNGFYSIGLHPWNIKDENVESDFEYLQEKCSGKNIVAIGECGFDKIRGPDMIRQDMIFERHRKISEELSKPLVIHCVKAYDEIISCRKKGRPSENWIIHGFNKSPETAMQLVNAGFRLSFGESIMNKEGSAAAALKIVPLESLFLETDDSEVSIADIYMAASSILGVSTEKLKEYQKYNFEKTFRIKI